MMTKLLTLPNILASPKTKANQWVATAKLHSSRSEAKNFASLAKS